MESEEHYLEILRAAVTEIKTARSTIARQINAAAIGVYWNLGKLLSGKKLEKGHGAGVVNRLSVDLKTEFPDAKFRPINLHIKDRLFFLSLSKHIKNGHRTEK